MPKKEIKAEELTILSVRNRRKTLDIAWVSGKDRYAVEFHENPLPSFTKAVEALGLFACALCEFRKEDSKKIIPTGITVREFGDDYKALITFRRKLNRGKRMHNVTTPLLPMHENEENKLADHMDEDAACAIELVIKEAKRYISGERAQGEIDFKDGEDEKKEEPKGGDNTGALPFEPGAVAQA